MNNHEEQKGQIAPLDKAGLYMAQIITDRAHGEIKKMLPVNTDLTVDHTRQPRYFSIIIINTPMGAMQHEFEIVAGTLEAAIDAYAESANQAGIDFVNGMKDAALRNSLIGKDFPQPAKARITN